MTESEWQVAEEIYNDLRSPISSGNYSTGRSEKPRGIPLDDTWRSGLILKRKCLDFESQVRLWKVKYDMGNKGEVIILFVH